MRLQLLIVCLVLLFTSFSFAQQNVEQFTSYNATYSFIDERIIEVDKTMSLRNLHSSGIVPGPIEFRTAVLENNGFEIYDLNATNRYEEPITSSILEFRDYTAISVNIFTPILPGFEYEINLNYKIRINESPGILFNRAQLPLLEDTRVPILEGEVTIRAPNNTYITHTSFSDNMTQINGNSIRYELDDNTPSFTLIEYSLIPSRIGNVAGSLVFWSIVNIILFSVLIFEIFRGFRRKKK